ncbi:uncharacterized protein LOC17874558 [Capsella rubella]|uniref:uncharacterized protein LOC17874558 n=1 Tax=Capsella rubella TaxID=81985 RepID=UPI000CD5A198|nr:uncharacterized protein LOC17874558 [Capsella rubella]
MDTTKETKFILFDTNAQKIVNQGITELLEGNFQEISDPTNVPMPLQNLVGKTYKFLATIATANITEGKETYKVSYVEMGDADQMCISNSNGTGDFNGTATNTPSSKRKENSIDVAEQSSSFKKMCLPSIKDAIEDEKVEGFVENGVTVPHPEKRGGEKDNAD